MQNASLPKPMGGPKWIVNVEHLSQGWSQGRWISQSYLVVFYPLERWHLSPAPRWEPVGHGRVFLWALWDWDLRATLETPTNFLLGKLAPRVTRGHCSWSSNSRDRRRLTSQLPGYGRSSCSLDRQGGSSISVAQAFVNAMAQPCPVGFTLASNEDTDKELPPCPCFSPDLRGVPEPIWADASEDQRELRFVKVTYSFSLSAFA